MTAALADSFRLMPENSFEMRDSKFQLNLYAFTQFHHPMKQHFVGKKTTPVVSVFNYKNLFAISLPQIEIRYTFRSLY